MIKNEAIQMMQSLDLTKYEAELYVALIQMKEGTASEISRIAQIPRARIYDVAQKLVSKGLIEIVNSRPLRYHALSVDLTLNKVMRRQERNISAARELLKQLEESPELDATQQGQFWIINGIDNIDARVEEMLNFSHGSILYVAQSASLVSAEIIEILSRKLGEGLEITLASPDVGTSTLLKERFPDSRFLSLPSMFSDQGSFGRLVISDGNRMLISTLTANMSSEIPSESAIWSDSPGFILTIGTLFCAVVDQSIAQVEDAVL